jgi:hypothetical protein
MQRSAIMGDTVSESIKSREMNEKSGTPKIDEAKAVDEVKKSLMETQSASFNFATAYTTVIIFGGYASLFTIWSYTREHLPKITSYRVALLMGVSILCFVLFEVFKMLLVSRELLKVRELLVNRLSPSEFLEKREKLARESHNLTQKLVLPVWAIILVVTVLTGVGASVLLLSAFATELAFPSLATSP